MITLASHLSLHGCLSTLDNARINLTTLHKGMIIKYKRLKNHGDRRETHNPKIRDQIRLCVSLRGARLRTAKSRTDCCHARVASAVGTWRDLQM